MCMMLFLHTSDLLNLNRNLWFTSLRWSTDSTLNNYRPRGVAHPKQVSTKDFLLSIQFIQNSSPILSQWPPIFQSSKAIVRIFQYKSNGSSGQCHSVDWRDLARRRPKKGSLLLNVNTKQKVKSEEVAGDLATKFEQSKKELREHFGKACEAIDNECEAIVKGAGSPPS